MTLTVDVVAGSRIHISLADLGFVSARSFGGVGFMVDKPAAHLQFRMADLARLEGATLLDAAAQSELADLLARLAAENGAKIEAEIISHGQQHVGLGLKTALKLSLIAGYDALARARLTRYNMQELSGRGGASGVGIHGFFDGGVLWDCGHPRETVESLRPSSASTPATPPLLMLRLPFPRSWSVGLLLPPEASICGNREQAFFRDNVPINSDDALRAMAVLYHGILPAFRSEELGSLANALAELARTGFKRREIERQSAQVQTFLGELRQRGYAAGMSSMGPLIFAVHRTTDPTAESTLQSMASDHGVRWLGSFGGLNRGALIRSVEST